MSKFKVGDYRYVKVEIISEQYEDNLVFVAIHGGGKDYPPWLNIHKDALLTLEELQEKLNKEDNDV